MIAPTIYILFCKNKFKENVFGIILNKNVSSKNKVSTSIKCTASIPSVNDKIKCVLKKLFMSIAYEQSKTKIDFNFFPVLVCILLFCYEHYLQ